MPSVSPGNRSKDTPSTALTAPVCLRNTMPRVSGKCLTRPRTRSTGSRRPAPGPRSAAGGAGRGAVVTEGLLPEVAGAGPAGADLVQRRHFGTAHLAGQRAARAEGAAGRDAEQAG